MGAVREWSYAMKNLLLLLALVVTISGQEDEDLKSEDEIEEAWDYVEFLKTDINENVEEILKKTLYEAKDKRVEGVVDDTITRTMEQIMEIREKLLTRIKNIRKNIIKIDPEQNIKQEKMLSEFRMEIMTILLKIIDGSDATVGKLKEISQDLLRFKLSVSNEIMRLLMLPKAGKAGSQEVTGGDCTECDLLEDMNYKIDNLIACAKEDKPIEDIDLPTEQEVISRPEAAGRKSNEEKPEPGTFCVDPNMYAMELITCNDDIDTEIKNLYNNLVIETDNERREANMKNLDFYKSTRNQVDVVITKLMNLDDVTRLKKTVTRSLGQISNNIHQKLTNCRGKCGPEGCDSCAADIIYDSIAKMKDYKNFFENSKDDEAKQNFVRGDMIKYINGNNAEAREILIKKAKEGKIDLCDEEKLEIFGVIKQPFWMLVNTTIQSEGSTELDIMVGTMIEILEQQLESYCSSTKPVRIENQEDGPNCDWEEYEKTKEYLSKVDEIIQESLFKEADEKAKIDAVLGFVDIQDMFNKRVKKLFEDQLQCPQEVETIKKQYMVQLNKCMAQFMNRNIKFTKMSRNERISCTKEMRNTMEKRVTKLIQLELEDTFKKLDKEIPDFLTEDGGDGPITDIDLPSDQQGVNRPG